MKHLLLLSLLLSSCALETSPLASDQDDAGVITIPENQSTRIDTTPVAVSTNAVIQDRYLLDRKLPISCAGSLWWQGLQTKSVEDYSWDNQYTNAPAGSAYYQQYLIGSASTAQPIANQLSSFKVAVSVNGLGCSLQRHRTCTRCQTAGLSDAKWYCSVWTSPEWFAPRDGRAYTDWCPLNKLAGGARTDIEVTGTTAIIVR